MLIKPAAQTLAPKEPVLACARDAEVRCPGIATPMVEVQPTLFVYYRGGASSTLLARIWRGQLVDVVVVVVIVVTTPGARVHRLLDCCA
jgi:hypothetical protein